VLVVVLLEEVSGLGEVRKVQREHVTAAEAAGGEPGGHALHAVGELAVGDRPPGRAVDHRRATGEPAGVAHGVSGRRCRFAPEMWTS
jgi:hypothetical protein